MLKHIIDAIRGMKTTATPGKTLIDTRKLEPAKKAKIKKQATTSVTKGRKPTQKVKK